MAERALFLDRDGTLVHPRHYPTRPSELLIYEGLAFELAGLQRAGFRLIVITNQSGLARAMFSEVDLGRMHAHLRAELAEAGVRLDGVYHCPHHPEGVAPELARACDCRKPAPGMLLRAAAEHTIDLARSWFVGDILDDVEAGRRAGCRTVLVDLGTEGEPEGALRWLRLVSAAIPRAPEPSIADARLPPLLTMDHEQVRSAALLGDHGGPCVALHVGAKDAARRWPAERFAALGDALAERFGAKVILTGGAGERELTAEVGRWMRAPAIDLAGATDLGTFAALLAKLDLLVTNDTERRTWRPRRARPASCCSGRAGPRSGRRPTARCIAWSTLRRWWAATGATRSRGWRWLLCWRRARRY